MLIPSAVYRSFVPLRYFGFFIEDIYFIKSTVHIPGNKPNFPDRIFFFVKIIVLVFDYLSLWNLAVVPCSDAIPVVNGYIHCHIAQKIVKIHIRRNILLKSLFVWSLNRIIILDYPLHIGIIFWIIICFETIHIIFCIGGLGPYFLVKIPVSVVGPSRLGKPAVNVFYCQKKPHKAVIDIYIGVRCSWSIYSHFSI